MPRHVISDAHECINEIPTVPIYHPAKPQLWERAKPNQWGKKTLLYLEVGTLEKPLSISGFCGGSVLVPFSGKENKNGTKLKLSEKNLNCLANVFV